MREFHPGRGAVTNPANRFVKAFVEVDEDAHREDDEQPAPRTQFLEDGSQSILSYNDSPDLGFDVSLNPYRGCEHGCSYCYARPTHEYLGFSAGLDFETRIVVKRRAAELLRAELMKPSWQPQCIAFSGVTDCYQPVERRLRLTRACLEVCAEFRNPVGIVTKNHAVTADIDVLRELARQELAVVYVSVTSLDPQLAKKMEPRASPPARRLAAIRELAAAGIPTGIISSPLIPGLNDHEMPAILRAGAEAGATFASYTVLRLPFGLKVLFEAWLEEHFPGQREKILGRIRDLREGRLNASEWGERMTGIGPQAEQLRALFRVARERAGLSRRAPTLRTDLFRRPAAPGQLELFD